MSDNNDRALTYYQLDGQACVECGTNMLPMVPIPGVSSSLSTQLFCCEPCSTRINIGELLKRVRVACPELLQ